MIFLLMPEHKIIIASTTITTTPDERSDCTKINAVGSNAIALARKNVLNEIDRLIENLSEIRYCIDNSQSDELYELLDKVCKNKITMQEKEPEPWKN